MPNFIWPVAKMISNHQLLNMTGQEPVAIEIKRKPNNDVSCTPNTEVIRAALDWNCQGQREDGEKTPGAEQ